MVGELISALWQEGAPREECVPAGRVSEYAGDARSRALAPATHSKGVTTVTQEFVPLLVPKDNVELDLGTDLLEAAEIPYVVGASDRAEMLQVLEGASAEGLHCLLVPKDRLEDAAQLLEEAWGPEVLKGRDPRG
jgi:hypothetical protein